MAIERQGLSTAWERRVVRTATVLAVVTLIVSGVIAVGLTPEGISAWASLPLSALTAYLAYAGMTRKLRRRRRILARPFPADWEVVLQREVVFFRALDPEDQKRFRRELQVFLGEKLITGIKVELDTTTRVLAGASAIIPIFGFPEWEWDQINEILVYPDRFDREFAFENNTQRQTLGMVGEFAHLVDKSDGTIDGLPSVGLERAAVGPWIELVRRKMEEMRRGASDIDPYGLTNEAEFFAVATEYFFERPGVMERKHPELYAMLSRVFDQSPGERSAVLAREMKRGRPRFGRNSPCPCGSGVKYKKCCLKRSRSAS